MKTRIIPPLKLTEDTVIQIQRHATRENRSRQKFLEMFLDRYFCKSNQLTIESYEKEKS